MTMMPSLNAHRPNAALALCAFLVIAGGADGWGLSIDCNTEAKMMACCELYEKSDRKSVV